MRWYVRSGLNYQRKHAFSWESITRKSTTYIFNSKRVRKRCSNENQNIFQLKKNYSFLFKKRSTFQKETRNLEYTPKDFRTRKCFKDLKHIAMK